MSAANFANRTLWTADNLDVLRGMNSACVDLIYADPPFNSNRDYAAPIGSEAAGAAFKDTWTLSDVDEAWHGLIAEQEPALYRIIDAAGIAHGAGMKSYLIMMGIRLLELRRVLKDNGSIYIHCDATANAYLRLLMDAIYGGGQFRSEVTWRRTSAKGLASAGYPNNADTLLYYGRGHPVTWNQPFRPLSDDYVRRSYRHVEPGTGRRYRLDNLVNPNKDRPNLTYEFLGVHRVWRWTRERMQAAYDAGRVVQSKPGAVPAYKRYLDESRGAAVDTVWDDIAAISAQAAERVGYPTQKPLALLERVIQASSNPGDLVLDPFCGCATALVAAEKHERQWAGIDLSPVAQRLIAQRLQRELGLFGLQTTYRDDIPRRTDQGELPNYRTHKHVLFGRQEGLCAGCRVLFPFRNFTVDHIIARRKGGTDHLDNLQLLCGACNSLKGDRDQAYLVARLKEQGHAQA